MKLLDVGAGIAKVAAVAAAVPPKPKPALSAEAQEEMRRRAAIDARAEATRAEREAALFGTSRWLGRRPGWLERSR